MPIKCEEYNQVCVVSVEGDFTGEVSAAVHKTADERIDQRHIVDFVIDMEKSPFIDSEGLTTLLWLKRRCEDLFGQLKLANADENIRKILEITRLDHRFDCHKDLASAVKGIR